MPGLVGADVDQLRALSRRFTVAADRLRGVVTEISGRLNAVGWAGPDSERFRAQWQHESVGRLRSVADALQEAAMVLQRNADEQDQASSVTGGWGWPGDLGAQPWFLRPGGGLPDPGMTPVSPHNGAGPRWSFPNPFAEYRDFVEKTPIWPISVGTAIAMTPLGAAMDRADVTALAFDDRLGPGDKLAESAHLTVDLGGGGLRQAGFDTRNPALYLGGVAVSQWGDVVSEAAKADFSRPTVANNVDFITAHPGEAFAAARDAVLGYLPTLISNFTVNPFGK